MASLDIPLGIPKNIENIYEDMIYPHLVSRFFLSSWFFWVATSRNVQNPWAEAESRSLTEAMLKRGGSMQSLLSLGSRKSNRSLDADHCRSDVASERLIWGPPKGFFGQEMDKSGGRQFYYWDDGGFHKWRCAKMNGLQWWNILSKWMIYRATTILGNLQSICPSEQLRASP